MTRRPARVLADDGFDLGAAALAANAPRPDTPVVVLRHGAPRTLCD